MTVTRPGSPIPDRKLKKPKAAVVPRSAEGYVNPQSNPGKFNLTHISGNWNRVACDFQRQFLEKYPSARILDLHDSSVPTYTVDMEAALQAMIRMGQIAKAAGCDVAAIACNTMHLHKKRFEEETGLKMLDMIQAVKDKIAHDFCTHPGRVGIVGSIQTMASDLYSFEKYNHQDVSDKKQIQVFYPGAHQQEILNKLIVQHKKATSPYMSSEFIELLKNFAEEKCLDCIVLGCTDFATLLQERVEDKFSYNDIGRIPGVENLQRLSLDSATGGRTVYLYDSVQCLVDACCDHVCRYENIHT